MYTADVYLEVIREDYGASDSEIARGCGVSRHHINQVRHGHKQASQALTKQLAYLYQQLSDSNEAPPRKPYTWRSGQDIRRQAVADRRQVHTPPPRPSRKATTVNRHPTEPIRASETPPPIVTPWRPVDTLVRSARSTEQGEGIAVYTFTGVEDI